MICPKGFLHAWLEYLMTFWADVFYISEIVSAYDGSPYGSNYHPNDKRPPYASDDPEYDREPLQCCNRNSGQDHCPSKFLKFFLALHNCGYVTDGFERERCLAFQSVFQFTKLFQFLPLLRYFLLKDGLMLFNQQRNYFIGMLFFQYLRNCIDRQIQFTQKTNDLHTLQVVFRVKPSSAFGKPARDQDASGIVILNRSDRNTAELCKFSRRVF